jgi:flagellar hook-length control protein FliK
MQDQTQELAVATQAAAASPVQQAGGTAGGKQQSAKASELNFMDMLLGSLVSGVTSDRAVQQTNEQIAQTASTSFEAETEHKNSTGTEIEPGSERVGAKGDADKTASGGKSPAEHASVSERNHLGDYGGHQSRSPNRIGASAPDQANRTAEAAEQAATRQGISKLSAGSNATETQSAKSAAAETASGQEARNAAGRLESGLMGAQANSANAGASPSQAAAGVADQAVKGNASQVDFQEMIVSSAAKQQAATNRVMEMPQAQSGNSAGQENGSGGEQRAAENTGQPVQAAEGQAPPEGGRNFTVAAPAGGAAQARPATQAPGTLQVAPVAPAARAQTNIAEARAAKAAAPQPMPQENAQKIIQQVVRAARFGVREGRDEAKLLLRPESLGWLKIRIAVEGQRVSARISVENEGVKQLLENNINSLQQALQNQNLRVSQIVVEVMGEAERQNKESHGGSRQEQKRGNQVKKPEVINGRVLIPVMDMSEVALVDLMA